MTDVPAIEIAMEAHLIYRVAGALGWSCRVFLDNAKEVYGYVLI